MPSTRCKPFFNNKPATRRWASDMAIAALRGVRDQQTLALSYFDVYWLLAVVAGLMVILVQLMRRSVAEKGAHIGAE